MPKAYTTKATHICIRGVWYLISYNRIVASVTGFRFARNWGGYSATTLRHVNAFREHFLPRAGDTLTKRQWEALPVEDVAI